jgi:hypothetical protein
VVGVEKDVDGFQRPAMASLLTSLLADGGARGLPLAARGGDEIGAAGEEAESCGPRRPLPPL